MLCGSCAPQPVVLWNCWYVLHQISYTLDGKDYIYIYHRNGRDDLWRRKQCLLKCGVLIQKGEEKICKFEQQVAALPGRKGGDGSRQSGMRSKRSSRNSGPSKAQRPSLLTSGASPTKSSWQQCLGFRPSVVFGTGQVFQVFLRNRSVLAQRYPRDFSIY